MKFNLLNNKLRKIKSLVKSLLCTLAILSVGQVHSADIYQQAINSAERPQADLKLDKTRKPELILPFSQIQAGDKVLELGAGGGYTTELLANVVGSSGKVYAQALSPSRTASGRLTNVVALRRHLLYQLPEVLSENSVKESSLDAVVIFFALHDFYLSSRMDQQGILKMLHRFLKPDGRLIILDNAAAVDAGNSVNRQLHRIGENFVIEELKKAGFTVDAKSDALRNPQDNHTQPWRVFNGLHDRFSIRFKKHKQSTTN